ncbi:MAG TPA: 2-oxo acid dehydrogenase subunit E2 [Polyangiaceae bacterium]|nr:2-oxo acid dehydrogenase subunit E2 [Polyangiaceae bacterium]
MPLIEITCSEFKESEGSVTSVTVAPGQLVSRDQVLGSAENDKVSVDIPAPAAGIVREVLTKTADTIGAHTVLFRIETSEDAPPQPATEQKSSTVQTIEPAVAPEPAPAELAEPAQSAWPGSASFRPTHASPSVRRIALEWGADIARVRGSGPHQRVLERDLKDHVRTILARAASAPANASLQPSRTTTAAEARDAATEADSEFGPVEVRPLSLLRKTAARRVTESASTIPHVTQFGAADITELERWRLELNAEANAAQVKLTLLPFILNACAAALRAFPELNASFRGDKLVLKRFVHIGFAVDTPHGLLVPVVRDVDQLSITELARAVRELTQKAVHRKLTTSDLRGGCFTVSSLGSIGGRAFTPIINPPEVAILGVSRHSMEARWDGERFQPRLMLPLSLSYDHRAVDGAAGARFLAHIGELLSDLRRALL